MGSLTTHVLDTANGRPAAGVRIELARIEGEAETPLATAITNDDGRTDGPMAEGAGFAPGVYQLTFHVGAYFGARHGFLDQAPVRFRVTEDAHYHVPLLVSPYGYSTYRGI